MFEDILGPSKPKNDQNCVPTPGPGRVAWNGKCNGHDVDDQHIYFNYVDMTNGRTYNIKFHWPEAVSRKMFKKDDPVEVVFYDPNVPMHLGQPQRCKRLDIRSKKWDTIDVQEIIKR